VCGQPTLLHIEKHANLANPCLTLELIVVSLRQRLAAPEILRQGNDP